MKKKFLLLTVLASCFTLSANVAWQTVIVMQKFLIVPVNLLMEWCVFSYFTQKKLRSLFVIIFANCATLLLGTVLDIYSDSVIFPHLQTLLTKSYYITNPYSTLQWHLIVECVVSIVINTLIQAPIALIFFRKIGVKKIIGIVILANTVSNIFIYLYSFYHSY